MGQMSSPKKELDLELTNMKRNPYLADYTEFKKRRRKQEAQGEKPEKEGGGWFIIKSWRF